MLPSGNAIREKRMTTTSGAPNKSNNNIQRRSAMKRALLLIVLALMVTIVGMIRLTEPAYANLSCIEACDCEFGSYCSGGYNPLCSGTCNRHAYQNCCAWCATTCGVWRNSTSRYFKNRHRMVPVLVNRVTPAGLSINSDAKILPKPSKCLIRLQYIRAFELTTP